MALGRWECGWVRRQNRCRGWGRCLLWDFGVVVGRRKRRRGVLQIWNWGGIGSGIGSGQPAIWVNRSTNLFRGGKKVGVRRGYRTHRMQHFWHEQLEL